MGLDDKLNNAATNHLGVAKEGAGKLTGNEELQRERQRDQAQAKLQEAGEKVKDAAKGIGSNLKDAAAKVKEGFSKE
ncbi:CsbD family protein [Pseudarthrobacter sp902506025]|uniref:Uncharacterized protein YjbJ (UPF0337 family) n=1 Tax=Pseudarthrobacter defluvii TaxID=410837 RepID=A0ABT9UJL2_9MICC|nr:CsbD family protein [Pseudarthrobacter defluvii]MDQ0119810.1 uncharacterized protein YjbJ (UPF0337 family) [Pseudarthrobacter defluvii]